MSLTNETAQRAWKQHLKAKFYLVLKSLTMTTKTIKQPQQPVKRVRPEKFRVIPNLSLKGRELMTRLKNRSISISSDFNHTLEQEYDEIRRMTKKDILRKSNENNQTINNIKNKLQNAQRKTN